MNSLFYIKLAFSNIKKNAKLYIPYILTSLFTVSMYHIIQSLAKNDQFMYTPGTSGTVQVCLELGVYVIIVFSIIFLFYTNSFLMKRRKKEIALYNVLGLGKGHIMKMMFFEVLTTSLIVIVGGIGLGLLFFYTAF